MVSGPGSPSRFQARELASVAEQVWTHPAHPVVPVVIAGATTLPAFAGFQAIQVDGRRTSDVRYVTNIVQNIVDAVKIPGAHPVTADPSSRLRDWQSRTTEIGNTIGRLRSDGEDRG